MPKILLVDDDPQSLEATRKILDLAGHAVSVASDGQSALRWVRSPEATETQKSWDLIVTDIRMPHLDGLEFLKALKLCGDTTPIILMTAFGRVEDAVWAMKLGAVDFLTKPFKRQQLLDAVESALKRKGVGEASLPAKKDELLIGQAPSLQRLREMIHQVAPTSATVLITGESGVGKELVAQCLHQLSPRAKNAFIALNCAAFPESLLESELFGYEKGAFTGATASKAGLLEMAHTGTLLLDEVGEMPLHLQAKLLRVLEDSEVRRLGATVSRKIEVRILAATNQKLEQAVEHGSFRQDLLYRLRVVHLEVPPLRDRLEDLPELIGHFVGMFAHRHSKQVKKVSAEAYQVFQSHSWPGNVRELANTLERAVIFSSSQEIQLLDLPGHLRSVAPGAAMVSFPLGTALRDVEEVLIRKTLEMTEGDKEMAAKILGINSRTVYRKLDKMKADEAEDSPEF